MPTGLNTRTVWLFDIDKLREVVASEKQLRDVTYTDIERETGVNWTQIAGFVTGKAGLGLHGIVSLAKWSNLSLDSLVVRQRQVAKHIMSAQERELRTLAKYLGAAGLEIQKDESPVDAAIRLLAMAREQGAEFNLDAEDDASE